MAAGAGPPVAILLSTYNGGRFLMEQLASVRAQSFERWILYWRDDGSTDSTCRIMQEFLLTLGAGRSVVVPSDGSVGASESFLRLLRAAVADNSDVVAFCDQDDVWLEQKLQRGLNALAAVPATVPGLYCARQILVDAELRRISLSARLRHPPSFPGALTQNIAAGCTLMLNHAGARLVAGSRAPAATLHDWWSYLMVAAAGGRLIFDGTPVVLYRQHAGNSVGASASLLLRGIAALRRGPAAFMSVFQQNVDALADQSDLLSPSARLQVMTIAGALRQGFMRRHAVLRMVGLRRQTWPETMLFRLWLLLH